MKDRKDKVRVRFAPSPTGGLHIGGVRTLIYNYLFALQHQGTLILRIEDTDRKRWVAGAEDYIQTCLDWLGIKIDEGPFSGGSYGPYRQSERKEIYAQYAHLLVKENHAYYAFDTAEDLAAMRERGKHIQYDAATRLTMCNSLTQSPEQVAQWLGEGKPYVIRMKVPEARDIECWDLLRGKMNFQSNVLDDKVLLKEDGFPTYHLAVVVDDYLMKISHVFRGEEWLPSLPAHQLLWKFFGWEASMPQWVHLPLILKPEGQGKLSKRDAQQLGVPIYPLAWQDPQTGVLMKGFKEEGFLKEAIINALALLSWNDGTPKEIFLLDELAQAFSLNRIHHQSVQFDYDKLKWFNTQHIRILPNATLLTYLKKQALAHSVEITFPDTLLLSIIEQTKERYTSLHDIWTHTEYFFIAPKSMDRDALLSKWTPHIKEILLHYVADLRALTIALNEAKAQAILQDLAEAHQVKMGVLQLMIRIFLTGEKKGVGVFFIMASIGKEASVDRIEKGIHLLEQADK